MPRRPEAGPILHPQARQVPAAARPRGARRERETLFEGRSPSGSGRPLEKEAGLLTENSVTKGCSSL